MIAKESYKDMLLRLWKARQVERGYDVSKVETLEQADHFFDEKTVESVVKTEEVKKVKKYKELQEEAASLGLKHIGVSGAKLAEDIELAKQAKKDIPLEPVIEGTDPVAPIADIPLESATIVESVVKTEEATISETKEPEENKEVTIPDGTIEPIGE